MIRNSKRLSYSRERAAGESPYSAALNPSLSRRPKFIVSPAGLSAVTGKSKFFDIESGFFPNSGGTADYDVCPEPFGSGALFFIGGSFKMKIDKLAGERFKEKPSDCVIDSHALMLRGGYMKNVANGIYSSFMPL